MAIRLADNADSIGHRNSAALAAAISLALLHVPVVSAAELEEIVVTAQKRAESLQDVPVTVNAFDGQQITENGIGDLEVLSENVPAVTIARSANSQRIFIRGIGSGTNNGFEQSVGTFMDGIYYGRGRQIRPKFIDLAQVEVLKGPQSTLFGTNVTAGAINITSNDPTDQFEGEIGLEVGEDSELGSNLVLSGPLTDRSAGRVALYTQHYDGYMENDSFSSNIPKENDWGGRAVLSFDAADDLSVRLAYEHHDLQLTGNNAQTVIGRQNGIPQFTGDPGVFDYHSTGGNLEGFTAVHDGPIKDGNTFDTVSLRMVYDVDGYTLTSVTGYTQYDWNNVADSDYTDRNLFAQSTQQNFEQWSQELRLEGSVGDRFTETLGLYYQYQDLVQTMVTELTTSPVGRNVVQSPAQQETTTWAVFGQGTYSFTDQLRGTLGGRYGGDSKDVTDVLTMSNPVFATIGFFGANVHDVTDSRDETHTSWLIRGEYDVNPDVMTYASASRGYKAGGFDINGLGASKGTTPATDFEFEDEKATSYELGAKMTLWGNAATLDTSAFYIVYDNMQVSQFSGARFQIGNAAKATVKGLELVYRQALTDEFTVSAMLTLQDFEFDEFKNFACNQAQLAGLQSGCVVDPVTRTATQDLSGKTGEFAPDFSANAALDYETPVGGSLLFRGNLNLVYSDSYYTQLGIDPFTQQDSYAKLNARVALAADDDRWEIALLGRNLTDEDVSVNSFNSPLASLGFPLTYVKFITQPRFFAVQATYRF